MAKRKLRNCTTPDQIAEYFKRWGNSILERWVEEAKVEIQESLEKALAEIKKVKGDPRLAGLAGVEVIGLQTSFDLMHKAVAELANRDYRERHGIK